MPVDRPAAGIDLSRREHAAAFGAGVRFAGAQLSCSATNRRTRRSGRRSICVRKRRILIRRRGP